MSNEKKCRLQAEIKELLNQERAKGESEGCFRLWLNSILSKEEQFLMATRTPGGLTAWRDAFEAGFQEGKRAPVNLDDLAPSSWVQSFLWGKGKSRKMAAVKIERHWDWKNSEIVIQVNDVIVAKASGMDAGESVEKGGDK